jgi:hypothetical protein
MAWLAHQDALVGGPLRSAQAVVEGRETAAVLLGAGLGAAGMYALLRSGLSRSRPSARVGRGLVAALVVAAVALVALSHPVRKLHHFTEPPPALKASDYVTQHFLSANGNWRYQFWQSAVDEFRTRPILGRGAGSFESWWDRRGLGFTTNPHSLYFETLGDLGLLGIVTLLAAFAVGVGGALRRWRRLRPELRDTVAAALAGFLAYALAAGVEWLWELPAASAVGLLLLGLALAPDEAAEGDAPPKWRMPTVVPVVLAVALVLAVEVDLHTGDSRLAASRAALARGDVTGAAGAARSARRYEPWASTPYLQLALAYEAAGDPLRAKSAILDGLKRETDSWRLWLVAARLERKLGNTAASRARLKYAIKLNPRSAAFFKATPR